jgi:hypothetical protein
MGGHSHQDATPERQSASCHPGTWNSHYTISEADVPWNPTPRNWFVSVPVLIWQLNPKATN